MNPPVTAGRRRKPVFSLEQALSLPYATLRFAQLGWRVIKIEAPPTDAIHGCEDCAV